MVLSYSLCQSCMILSLLPQNLVVLSLLLQNHMGPVYLLQNHVVLSSMAAAPRFKSQCPSSFVAPFPIPPTISYTCQHSLFFQLYWATTVSLGRCGSMAWSQSSPSSHAGSVTRGSCLPVTSWVEFTPTPPSKHAHSYLTYL